MLGEFADGIYFVSLVPIKDPDLVIPTVYQILELREAGERSLLGRLKSYLRDKRLLLVLDNFEQAAPEVAKLLAECQDLKVLVTSRAVPHLFGEHEFPVAPLELPELGLPQFLPRVYN